MSVLKGDSWILRSVYIFDFCNITDHVALKNITAHLGDNEKEKNR